MMPESWREAFRIHAGTPEYRWAIARARVLVRQFEAERVVVPFSGGKDSSVLLHLAATHCPDLVVTHFDFGRPGQKRYNVFPAALERAILDNGHAIAGRTIHVITKRKYWRDDAAMQADRPATVRIHSIPDTLSWIIGSMGVARSLGCTVNMVGLRKAESVRRRHRITEGRQINGAIIRETWPIGDLSDRDVWAYIVEHDIPYPALYDQQAAVTGDYLRARLTSLFRDPAEAVVPTDALDGVLNWRHRGPRS